MSSRPPGSLLRELGVCVRGTPLEALTECFRGAGLSISAYLETLKIGMVINPMWMKTSRLGELSSVEELLLAKSKLGFESK